MAKRNMSKCQCGRVKSQYLPYCKKCTKERDERRYAEARAIVAIGVCPDCGAKIKQNLSITGWYQCEQYGAVTHRKNPNKPSCGWQTFTC